MEARTCEEYVLQTLEGAIAEVDRLRDGRDRLDRRVGALQDELARFKTKTHDAIYAAGRKAVFDRLAYCEGDWGIKDFDEWCHACCYYGTTHYDEFGGVDGFVEEFKHEFRDAWLALADD